jgi:hypothetical protein
VEDVRVERPAEEGVWRIGGERVELRRRLYDEPDAFGATATVTPGEAADGRRKGDGAGSR